MKAPKKIIRKLTISLLAVLIGNILGCHPAGIPSVEAAFVAGVECTSDINCRPGEFCRLGFHMQKFCVTCLECSRFNRHPNPENECAKRRNECGPCLDGYAETHEGGVCTFIGEESKDETTGREGAIKFHPWMVIGPAVIAVVILLIVGCSIWKRNKQSEVHRERLQLHPISPSLSPRIREGRFSIASAPLVEYQQQPAFHLPTAPFSTTHDSPPAYIFESEVRNPRVKMENYNRADPFQAGYGAGDWAIQEPEGANDNQNLNELEDMVDGNPPGVVGLNADESVDLAEPLLDNLQDGILSPENGLNELDQENIEEIINNDMLPQNGPVQPPQHHENQNADLYFGIQMHYELGLFRHVDRLSDNHQLQQQSNGFDPSATRADLSSLISSGPGSPESNDSGTNMEVEDFENETEDADSSVSREVPVMQRRTAQDSLLYEDENSFDSMYEDAVEEVEFEELIQNDA